MKKNSVKKLTLSKETVRSLDFSHLTRVEGGITTTSDLCSLTSSNCTYRITCQTQ
jgi:hypothetical protein